MGVCQFKVGRLSSVLTLIFASASVWMRVQFCICVFVVLTFAQGVFHFSVVKEQTLFHWPLNFNYGILHTDTFLSHLNYDKNVRQQWEQLLIFSLLLSWYFKSGWMSLIYKAFCFYNHVHTCVTVMRKATYIIWSLMQIDKTQISNRSCSHTCERTRTFLLLLCQTERAAR